MSASSANEHPTRGGQGREPAEDPRQAVQLDRRAGTRSAFARIRAPRPAAGRTARSSGTSAAAPSGHSLVPATQGVTRRRRRRGRGSGPTLARNCERSHIGVAVKRWAEILVSRSSRAGLSSTCSTSGGPPFPDRQGRTGASRYSGLATRTPRSAPTSCTPCPWTRGLPERSRLRARRRRPGAPCPRPEGRTARRADEQGWPPGTGIVISDVVSPDRSGGPAAAAARRTSSTPAARAAGTSSSARSGRCGTKAASSGSMPLRSRSALVNASPASVRRWIGRGNRPAAPGNQNWVTPASTAISCAVT